MNDTEKKTKSLEHAFLRHIGVESATQRQVQSHYLPFFEDCTRVVDLGCGDGDFTQMLIEQGIEAIGVDSDFVMCQHTRERGIPVVCEDALAYLEHLEPASIDGIYAAHLVEHLPYQAVLHLIELAYRALAPGGRILLVTPNARALISHLEMFYLHFGHQSFYHPRLLEFFLDWVGFQDLSWGENPHPEHPLFGRITLSWEMSVPSERLSPWRNALRVRLARLLGLDDLVRQMNEIVACLRSLDKPFECYATGIKR